MKKILAWMLALCLLLSLAACGGPAVSPVGPDEGGEPVGVQDPENDKENNGPDETDDIGDSDGSGGGSGSSSKPSGSGSGSSSGSSNKPSGSGSGSSSGSSDKPSSGGSGSGNSSKPGHKHSYTSKVVAPTTEAGGYTLHTCSRCGSSYKDSYTDPLPKPEVYLDCAAAEAYGNQYALSLFHHIDATLRDGNAGYIPSSTYDRKSLLSWGGQTALNNEVCEKVNSTYRRLLARGDTAEDLKLYAGIRCEVVYAASRDEYTITVYYG